MRFRTPRLLGFVHITPAASRGLPKIGERYVFNKPLINLTAALIVATTAFASARVFTYPDQTAFQPDHKKSATKAGIVSWDGSIVAGTGYAVSHDGAGEYTLDVPAGKFKTCPVILVTPSGVHGHAPIANDYNYITCGSGSEVKIQVRFYARNDGALQDNSFHFFMTAT